MINKIKSFFINYFNQVVCALINIFLFFPYFFSVITLIKTLFYPWKNLVYYQEIKNFSFSAYLEKFAFNAISSTIGFVMRFSLLSFWLILQTIYLFSIPIILFIALIFSPLFFILNLLKTSPEKTKVIKKNSFVKEHLLSLENIKKVESWFEDYYQEKIKKDAWYTKENLFSYPPLARDWAFGYTYYLNQYSEELTAPSYLESRPTVIDRENELKQIEEILSKSRYDNVLIVGEDGVGKHTIVDALAYRIYHGQTTPQLMYHRILKLNMEKIIASFLDQNKREIFFQQLLEEAVLAKNIIIFIDKFDRYISSTDDTRTDLSSVIEKYAKSSKIQLIGITNPFFYQKYIFPLEKINQIFTKIDVPEISEEVAEKILLKIALKFENKYQVKIAYEAIKEVIYKSSFYITDIPFPEKAIELLDLACSEAKIDGKKLIDPDLINQILTEKTKIPTQLTPQIKEKLLNLNSLLKKEIFGQDLIMEKLSLAVSRAFILIGKRKKPLASFLFLGPTGVGKTETAKVLAKIFFGSASYLQRFDMSLYQTEKDIQTLIGSFEKKEPGLLAQAIRQNPYGVLLLDEIEKANRNLLNIFLTIFDEGYFTDSFGKKVDCKNLFIIATSNAGSDIIFTSQKERIDDNFLINYLIEKKIFTPEFLNRFDGVLFYNPLSKNDFLNIAQKIIQSIKKDIYQLYKIHVKIDDSYLLKLINERLDPRFGARNLERILKESIENEITKFILENNPKEESLIILKAN